MKGKLLVLTLMLLTIFSLSQVSAVENETAHDLLSAFEAYMEIWETGHTYELTDVVTEDFVLHTYGSKDFSGQALMYAIESFGQSRGFKFECWLEDATMQGDWLWLTVNEKLQTVESPQIYQVLARFEDGKLAEVWRAHNALLVLEMLGALPEVTFE